MKSAGADRVIDLMEGYIQAAAVNTALAKGLFWMLSDKPQSSATLAERIGFPESRCRFLLEILADLALVDRCGDGFTNSPMARSAILQSYDQQTWGTLARMAMERLPAVVDLPKHISDARSVWEAQGLEAPTYFSQVLAGPTAARDYTRMLAELHRPLADAIAGTLEIGSATSLLDIGGGSGVVALALLRRHPELQATVMDFANVCAAGREIARGEAVADRIEFHPGDFTLDPLSGTFDLILTCDTGPYNAALFAKICAALAPDGHLVLVEQFPGDSDGALEPPWLNWAFRGALHDLSYSLPSFVHLEPLLAEAGLQVLSRRALPCLQPTRWARGWSMVVAGRAEASRQAIEEPER